ncbi:Rrf2 family transcriptional regulator [Limnoglobus roseus]|nr:Rrf2 family transcriptional regulator [Limnoglobus roseus]
MTASAPIDLAALWHAGATLGGLPVASVRVTLASGAVVHVRLAAADLAGPVPAAGLSPPPTFRPNPCSRDVLAILEAAEGPLVLPDIRQRLENREQLHGESTVRKVLAAMVRAGILTNPGHRAGYSLARPPAAS